MWTTSGHVSRTCANWLHGSNTYKPPQLQSFVGLGGSYPLYWIGGRRSEVRKPLKSNTVGCIPLLGMTMCTWCPLGQVMNTHMVQTWTPLEQVVPIGSGCSALRSSYNPHWYPNYFIFFTLVVTRTIFRCFKFTLKPPYRITCSKLWLAIWDTSFWTFWLKFGHKGPWDIS